MKLHYFAFLLMIVIGGVSTSGELLLCAESMSFEEAKMKAAQYQTVSQSGIIHTQENGWAQYYQNIQMIQLLTEIREDLEKMRESIEEIKQKEKSALASKGALYEE